MSQRVPDWDGEGGSCSLDVSGDGSGGGGLVPRECRTDNNDPFSGAIPDDVWPWWDWDVLDDVAELKWIDGQPRVHATKPPTPTHACTAPTALTPFSPPNDDTTTGCMEDLDLVRWLSAEVVDEERRHPDAAATPTNCNMAADAIVPGCTGRLPGGGMDSVSCSQLLVPDMWALNQTTLAAASANLTTTQQEFKRPHIKVGAVGEGMEREEKRTGVKRRREPHQHHQQQQFGQQQRQAEDVLQVASSRKELGGQHDESGTCSASAAKKARCRSAISERKRRDKFNQKIRTLQKLVPNCGKVDKVSILDEVIAHVRELQAQAQMHMMTGVGAGLSAVSPPSQPPAQPIMMSAAPTMATYMQNQFRIMAQMAAQMSQMGFTMGISGANSFFPQASPQGMLDLSSRKLMPAANTSQHHQMIARSDSYGRTDFGTTLRN